MSWRFAPNTEWVCDSCGAYRLHQGYTPPPGWQTTTVCVSDGEGERLEKQEHRCASCAEPELPEPEKP